MIAAVGSLALPFWLTATGGVTPPAPVPSATFTTFTSADYTPDADESPTTLTLTVKDANDDPIADYGVTYA
jgi:hypothetical protein